jgi:hypothetical protein
MLIVLLIIVVLLMLTGGGWGCAVAVASHRSENARDPVGHARRDPSH